MNKILKTTLPLDVTYDEQISYDQFALVEALVSCLFTEDQGFYLQDNYLEVMMLRCPLTSVF